MLGYVSMLAEQTLTHSRFTRSTLVPTPPSLQYAKLIICQDHEFLACCTCLTTNTSTQLLKLEQTQKKLTEALDDAM